MKDKIKINDDNDDNIYTQDRNNNKTPIPSFDINNKTDRLILNILYELDTMENVQKQSYIHSNLDTNENNEYKNYDFFKNNEIINLIKYENIKQFIDSCD
jgi:hypothetical protein